MSLLLFLALLLLGCGYAMLRGGTPERVGAAMQFAAFVASFIVHRITDEVGYLTASTGALLIDASLFIGLLLLAWRSTRFWPLWLAGWQMATVIAHLAKQAYPAMQGSGYAVQAQIWSYPMLVATAIGAWRYRRRCEKGVAEPDWKPRPYS